MKDMNTALLREDEATVNEIISARPETVDVLDRFGIDACCGGSVPVTEAARRDGADPEAVWAALRLILGEEG